MIDLYLQKNKFLTNNIIYEKYLKDKYTSWNEEKCTDKQGTTTKKDN